MRRLYFIDRDTTKYKNSLLIKSYEVTYTCYRRKRYVLSHDVQQYWNKIYDMYDKDPANYPYFINLNL